MTHYREILRFVEMGLSRTSIGTALGYSRNTVADVLHRAQVKGVELPLPDDLSDQELGDILFPEKAKDQKHKMPDCENLHKELGKSGVTLTILWDEHCNEYRQNGQIPYAFTQFRYHYHRLNTDNKATSILIISPASNLKWTGREILPQLSLQTTAKSEAEYKRTC